MLSRLSATALVATVASQKCLRVDRPSESLVENTINIQGALDEASANEQGCVSVAAGDWPVKRLIVKSNTQLTLEEGCRLVNVINQTTVAVVQVGPDSHNVSIFGPGIIYGSSEKAWQYWSEYDNRMSPYEDDGTVGRAHCLLVTNSDDVRLAKGLKLHNSTDWTVRMDNSSNIFADDIDIYGDSRFPNNDGFDPQSCVNVTLLNSRIDVADDGVCPKADKSMGPLTNLYVRNVTIRSKSHAIKFGSNTDTLMSNIVFDNITIWDSNGGMSIQQRSMGNIENVTWSNIKVETRYQAPRWWGNGEWLTVSNNFRDVPVGTIRNMQFVNISGRSENGGLLSGLTGGVDGITFDNINIKIAAWSNYSLGPQECCAEEQVCVGEMCVPHPLPTGTKIPCMGTRDYRPTPIGAGSTCPKGHDRVPSKADGLVLENAHNVVLKDVTIEFETPRKDWFGECVVVDKWSNHVTGAADVKCINGADKTMIPIFT